MNKINVCLLNDSFPPIIDGVANAVVNYAANIEEKWGHAIVAAPSYPGADDSVWPFPVYRFPSIDVRKKTSGYVLGIPFSPELSAGITRQKIDILHTHCPMMSAVLSRAMQKRLSAPIIITYHTKYDIDIANVVRNKALQQSGIRSVVTNVSACDEVWVVSNGAGENLRSLGYEGDYIVMRNGVDLPRERVSDQAVQNAVQGYDLPEGVPVFLFVGRLMWYKGIQIILDALKKLKILGKDFRMVIVGDGGDSNEIRSYTRMLDLNDKVIFTGVVSGRQSVRAWYTRADLFLFPSTFDSNGLVVREAASCELASVLIEGSCAAEGVRDGHNAFLIQENADSMVAMLLKIMDNPAYMHEVGKNASDELYLSWEEAVSNAVERYHIVSDLYKRGAYKNRKSFSDNLFATQGDLMYTAGQIGQALNQGKLIAQDILTSKNSKRWRAYKNSRKIKIKKSVHKK